MASAVPLYQFSSMRCCGGRTSTYSPSSRLRKVQPAARWRSRLRGLVLGQDEDAAEVAVDAVGEGEVDDAVEAAEGHGRLGAVAGQRLQAGALAAGQDHRQDVSHGALLASRASCHDARPAPGDQGAARLHQLFICGIPPRTVLSAGAWTWPLPEACRRRPPITNGSASMPKRTIAKGRLLAALSPVLLGALALTVAAPWNPEAAAKDEPRAKAADQTVELTFLYGSEKEEWIKDVTDAFNKSGAKTAAGKAGDGQGDAGRLRRVHRRRAQRARQGRPGQPGLGGLHPAGQRPVQGEGRQGADRPDQEPRPLPRRHRHVEAHGRGPRLAGQARRLGGHPRPGERQGRLGVEGQGAVGLVQVRPHPPRPQQQRPHHRPGRAVRRRRQDRGADRRRRRQPQGRRLHARRREVGGALRQLDGLLRQEDVRQRAGVPQRRRPVREHGHRVVRRQVQGRAALPRRGDLPQGGHLLERPPRRDRPARLGRPPSARRRPSSTSTTSSRTSSSRRRSSTASAPAWRR